MTNKITMKQLAALFLMSGLSACGGGSSEGGSGEPTPPAPVNSRVVSGAIEEVNADRVRINGQWFNISNAAVAYANDVWSEPLQAGMDVDIVARAAQAERITLNPLLTGQLQSAGTSNGAARWQVNGVPLTQVDQAASAGSWVMVFGDYDSQGAVVPRELSSLNSRPVWIEVESRVQGHDSNAQRFNLGQIQVNYQGAQIEDGPIQEGRWVEAFGRLEGNVLQATELDFAELDSLPDESEIAGHVQFFDLASGLLELDRQRQIRVTGQTRFEGGTYADLQRGARVEVEVRRSGSELIATEIDLEGERQPILTAGQQFKLAGLASWDGEQLTINGIPFLLDGVTRFEGGLNQSTLGGRWVELDGIVNQGMNLVREVEPDVQDDELELTGTVSASDNSLWGYHAADGSLQRFAGQWVALDCDFDGNVVSNCRRDD